MLCGSLRRFLAASATALGLLLAAAPGAHAAPPIRTFFGPSEDGLGIAEHFLDYVDGARERLDLCFYEFRYDPIVSAVLDAHARGVRVRVVVDDTAYFQQDEEGALDREQRNPYVRRLLDAGVDVRPDDRSAIMHHKFAVRDGEALWTGSFNLTDTGTLRNANNAVWIDSPELAEVYTHQFEDMFERGHFGPGSPRQLGQDVEVDGTRFEVRFSPEDDPNERIRELIEQAQGQVYFMQFAFTDSLLSDALIARRRADPHFGVMGIFDRLLHRATGPYNEFAKLTDAGIPVVIDNRREGKLHHKVFLIDPDGDDPCVVLGSANASASAASNNENVLILHDHAVAQLYKREFLKLFGKLSTARAEIMLRGLPVALRKLPDADLVITSGGQEITAIRVESPARWKPEEPPTLVVHRNGEEVTDQVDLRVQGHRRLEIRRPMLERYGRNAYLVVKFKGLRLPEIAGGYALYVTVRDRAGEWRPLAQQPSFEVFEDLAPETIGALLDNLTRLRGRLDDLRKLGRHERHLLMKHFRAAYTQLVTYVVETVRDDDLRIAEAIGTYLEQLDEAAQQEVRRIIGRDRELRQALAAAAQRGVEGAAALHERLEVALKSPLAGNRPG